MSLCTYKGRTALPREIRYCACGCGDTFECKVNSKRKFLHGHNRRNKREIRTCACGCKQTFECRIDSKQKYFTLQCSSRSQIIPYEIRTCECGCGEIFASKVTNTKRYVIGHNARVTPKSVFLNNFGVHCQKGKTPWNMGLTKETDERINNSAQKMSCTRKQNGVWNTGLTKETDLRMMGVSKKLTGRKHLEVSKIKISKTRRERLLDGSIILYQKGKTYEEMYGVEKAKELKKTCWGQNDVNVRNKAVSKILSKVCQRPNKFELKCMQELNINYPNRFKYVGDGSVLVNGKSPDFICEEWKTVILCNGLYWHLFIHGLKDSYAVRRCIELKESEQFLKAGYEVWFIWEDMNMIDIVSDDLVDKLKEFYSDAIPV